MNMLSAARLLCLSAVLVMAAGRFPAFAQVETANRLVEDKPEALYLDAISFASSDSSRPRLDVYIQVGYPTLTFVKENDRYSASYEISLTLYDSLDVLTSEKMWTEEIKGVTFDQSVGAGAYSLTERSIDVAPGKYRLEVVMRDIESKATRHLVRRVVVPDFPRFPFSLSGIMIVSHMAQIGAKRSLTPSVSSNLGTLNEPVYAFFEAYNNRTKIDSIRYSASIVNAKGERQMGFDTLETVHRGKNDVLLMIDQRALPVGDYVLDIKAIDLHGSSEADSSIAESKRSFMMRWRGMPVSLKDLDVAIEQLRYIAKDSDIDNIKNAPTLEEKQKRFLDFWKKRSTNPNAQRNIRMEEYYARVDYANRHFSHYIDGWRTDMGMVYIIFGAPSNVDRHPYDMDAKPYEVWSYYDLNHQFVFVDESGFGDYRLLTPIWDVWRRPND